MANIMPANIEQVIHIKGARVHNLKNVDLKIPRDEMVVITGLSGSGKSSLAFDTLYAEGQRRYVESLSAYARQFLGRINKPDVDFINGIPPAVALEQRVNSRNPRSTVGTSTEIYDYIKLLFARIGKTYSPLTGKVVKRHSVSDVVDYLQEQEEGKRLVILSSVCLNTEKEFDYQLDIFIQQGMTRALLENKIVQLEELKGMQDIPDRYLLQLVVDIVRSGTRIQKNLKDFQPGLKPMGWSTMNPRSISSALITRWERVLPVRDMVK